MPHAVVTSAGGKGGLTVCAGIPRPLTRKLARGVAKPWPVLSGALSDRLGPLFAAVAAETSPPGRGGSLADSRALACARRPGG